MMAQAEDEMPAGWRQWDPLLRAQIIEIRSFMSSYLLSCQGDRVTMAHGIEARYPYLDPAVVEYCLALPKRFKLRGMNDKIALRKLAARRLPDAISGRRKQPFRAPIGQALFGPEAEGRFDHVLSAEALVDTGLIDVTVARQLVDKARRQGGRMGSEREEMGLTGLLTLGLLARHFGPGFKDRVREAERRLATIPLHFFRDELAETASSSALS
jgi:asparagine synthase (glutamine-hydrolysing)